MAIKQKETSTIETLLQYIIIFSSVLGLFYWEPNLYKAFWFRRFFAIFTGVLALCYLLIFHRKTLLSFLKHKVLVLFMGLSTINLIMNSSLWHAFFGYPLVHPGLASMFSSICIGLWLTSLNRLSVLRNIHYAILGWAIACFMYWLNDDISLRLGFVDSQVIYAACLFAVGGMLSIWHFKNKTMSNKYIIPTGLFFVICLLLSQTRSALLLIVIYALFTYRKSIVSRKKVMGILLVLTISCIAISGVYFSRLYDAKYLVRSIEYRGSLVLASLPSDKSNIFLGEGMGSIENNIRINGPKYSQLKDDIKDGVRFESSHNYLIDLVVERGLIVAIFFVMILIKTFTIGRKQKSAQDRIVFEVFIFMSVFLFFNNINIQMEIVFWSCIVLILQTSLKRGSKKLTNRTTK